MYTPHTWVDDEIITKDKLNNIEQGVSANDSAIPASASVSAGVITFANGSGTTVLQVALPVYDGGVS